MTKKGDAALALAMNTRRAPEKTAVDMAQTPFGLLAAEARDALPIPVDLIDRSPFQSRGKRDEEHIEALVAMIKEQGLITPIVVRRRPDGRYEHITGHNRAEAFRRLGRAEIPAIVREMDDRTAALALTADNTLHKSLTDWENYKHIKMLRDNGFEEGATELARVIGCSRAAIYRYNEYAKLPEPLHQMLDESPALIGGNLAYELKDYALSHSELVVTAATMLSQGKLKQSGVVSWIRRKVETRAIPERREFQYQVGGATIKMVSTDIDTRITGRIDAEKLHRLIEAHLQDLIVPDDRESDA